MKPLSILIRIIIVGLLWTVFFIEGTRVILLTNWHFDIFTSSHWTYAWNLWESGKWVIDDAKEWAFVLIIFSFIPLWLTGWAALSVIKWEKAFSKIMFFPLKLLNKVLEEPINVIKTTAQIKSVKKKKSYKEIRPRSLSGSVESKPISERTPPAQIGKPLQQSLPTTAARPTSSAKSIISQPRGKPSAAAESAPPKVLEHSLFQFEDDNSDDFDLSFETFDEIGKEKKESKPVTAEKKSDNNNKKEKNREKPEGKNQKDNRAQNQEQKQPQNQNQGQTKSGTNSIIEAIKQKGYEVITGATIKNNLIDFIGVSQSEICLCLIDKEPGDWLADEERFNNEEPLWFSESSHRISPVRKIDIARKVLKDKLNSQDFDFNLKAFVVIQLGNIINAEDMFEVWNEMDISVTRIDRGTPKELKLFQKSLEDADESIEKETFEKLKKLIRSI